MQGIPGRGPVVEGADFVIQDDLLDPRAEAFLEERVEVIRDEELDGISPSPSQRLQGHAPIGPVVEQDGIHGGHIHSLISHGGREQDTDRSRIHGFFQLSEIHLPSQSLYALGLPKGYGVSFGRESVIEILS
ncbi:MAG: hypothetical protein QW328_07740 [Nitrososphaerota archaeon]